MVPSFLRELFVKEKMELQQRVEQGPSVTNLPYHRYIRSLHTHFPHLEALSLYSEECEKSRAAAQLGSHDSNSILSAEIAKSGNTTIHRIDCYDHNDIEHYREMFTGTGDTSVIRSRILVIEDLSPAAIEILGSGFNLDPHVFYFHLGFDTRRSAMVDIIDPRREGSIPVTWCMPGHAPDNFISAPLPCDLKPLSSRKPQSGLPMSKTYSRQVYRRITDLHEPYQNWDPPQRAFHRVSLVFAQTEVETIVVLAFPTWKRISPSQSNVSQSPYNEVLDSYGFSLASPTRSSKLGLSQKNQAGYGREFERQGVWVEGQWERTKPLFQALVPPPPPPPPPSPSSCQEPEPESDPEPCSIRESALLWLYSKLNDHYFLACQNEGRCWRDLRAILDSDSNKGRTSQRPKRQFRDSMTKTIELLKIAIDWLDRTLDPVKDLNTYERLRRKVRVTLTYEEARLGQVLLNINDEQNEVQMKLMVQQLEESRYAIRQAISVGQLTKLAFIFVPLATVCSAFSMNLREMTDRPSIWLFVVIAVVCTIAAATASSEKVRGLSKQMASDLGHRRLSAHTTKDQQKRHDSQESASESLGSHS